MTRTAACLAAVACLTFPVAAAPVAHARGEGDTHISGTAEELSIDCNNATLFVNGTSNVITAYGTCYAVTMQGSGNVVIADTITDDITVYGWNQTVTFHNGDPYILDRGRELGMTNNINRA
ncbi:MAG: DUF3060 domain-containing protein [Mycobacteriaceae bacterium]|nr:DUF3060 domain-containing protein [Mycobacteriaceae bacterium]